MPSRLDDLIRCPRCAAARWSPAKGGFHCEGCGFEARERDGVLSLDPAREDEVSRYYDDIQGPHFVGTSFTDNLHVHCATQAYERHFTELLKGGGRALVDLGCGDGRFSLWALEHGWQTVVAVDRTVSSLRRLARTARDRDLAGLVALQASFDDPCLAPDAFDAALAIEAFTYLGDGYREALRRMRALLKPDGRGIVSEFCRQGRVLADVVAINLENMRLGAERGVRIEKSGAYRLEQRLFDVEELVRECEKAGLAVVDRRGISPVPMLFHYAWTFTSYPLRPALDASLQQLIEALDRQGDAGGDLSRNVVLLLKRA